MDVPFQTKLNCEVCKISPDACSESKLLVAFYRKVIDRYSDKISFGEEKSIIELKKLVVPSPKIIELSKTLEVNSSVEDDFPNYAVNCLNYLKEIKLLASELKFAFWLTPTETLDLGAGDSMDKALLLCSLLLAKGSSTATVRVLELEDNIKHVVVCFLYSDKAFVLDASQHLFWSGPTIEDVLSSLTINNKKIIKSVYEFNSEAYSSFQ